MKQQRSPTLFQLWFWLVTRVIGWLILGCFGCIAGSIVIVAVHGQDGFLILNQLLQSDYHYITGNVVLSHTLWVSRWIQTIPNSITQPNVQLPVISSASQHLLWHQLLPYINASLMGTKLLLIRLYLLLRWCLLFLILGMTGLVDGLAQRYIRRQAAGRESALIYHNAKPLIVLSLILGIFIDLILPISVIHTQWVLVVSSIIFCLAIQMTAKSFKKYL